MAIVLEIGQAAALAAGNNQVVIPVTVQVAPGHAGTELAEPVGQQGLPGEVVERVLVMHVAQKIAAVLEKRCDLRCRWWRSDDGTGFSDLVNVVGLNALYDGPAAVAPDNLD